MVLIRRFVNDKGETFYWEASVAIPPYHSSHLTVTGLTKLDVLRHIENRLVNDKDNIERVLAEAQRKIQYEVDHEQPKQD